MRALESNLFRTPLTLVLVLLVFPSDVDTRPDLDPDPDTAWHPEPWAHWKDSVAIAVMTSDAAVPKLLPALQATWLPLFPSHIVYTDSITDPEQQLVPCCVGEGDAGAKLGENIQTAQRKLEHTFKDFFTRFPGKDFYVYSDDDVYWSVEGLSTQLSLIKRTVFNTLPKPQQMATDRAVEDLMRAADARGVGNRTAVYSDIDIGVTALVSGGGQYPNIHGAFNRHIINGCFVVLTRAAMEMLTVDKYVDIARGRLNKMFEPGTHEADRHGDKGGGYSNDHLLMMVWKVINEGKADKEKRRTGLGKRVEELHRPTAYHYNRARATGAEIVQHLQGKPCAAMAYFWTVAAVHHLDADGILELHAARAEAHTHHHAISRQPIVLEKYPGLPILTQIGHISSERGVNGGKDPATCTCNAPPPLKQFTTKTDPRYWLANAMRVGPVRGTIPQCVGGSDVQEVWQQDVDGE
jgi:hypothetical protein